MMSDKTEKLNSALEHTRKAMQEIDNAAYISLIESTPIGDEFKLLEEVYQFLLGAEQRILELKV